jgi:hypothetical protein
MKRNGHFFGENENILDSMIISSVRIDGNNLQLKDVLFIDASRCTF